MRKSTQVCSSKIIPAISNNIILDNHRMLCQNLTNCREWGGDTDEFGMRGADLLNAYF